jgi:ASC-1-like (ASCH) protein
VSALPSELPFTRRGEASFKKVALKTALEKVDGSLPEFENSLPSARSLYFDSSETNWQRQVKNPGAPG